MITGQDHDLAALANIRVHDLLSVFCIFIDMVLIPGCEAARVTGAIGSIYRAGISFETVYRPRESKIPDFHRYISLGVDIRVYWNDVAEATDVPRR